MVPGPTMRIHEACFIAFCDMSNLEPNLESSRLEILLSMMLVALFYMVLIYDYL